MRNMEQYNLTRDIKVKKKDRGKVEEKKSIDPKETFLWTKGVASFYYTM